MASGHPSCNRIVVSTSRCGRDNPGSNPGYSKFFFPTFEYFYIHKNFGVKFFFQVFDIDWRRGFLYWKSEDLKTSQSNKEEGYVDLLQVQEIVPEIRFKFDRELQNIPIASCFSIYYGVEFNLNVLILYSKDGTGVVSDWINGLKFFCRHLQRESFWSRSSRILQREYRKGCQ